MDTANPPTFEDLRRALVDDSAPPTRRDEPTRAAVALVLRPNRELADLLFIRRAEHPLDPWSGHMAFPGGRVDPGDRDPLAAARRETREELALDLESSTELLGSLDPVPVVSRGRRLRMTIQPFVFELTREVTLTPNEEVDEAIWIPLERLADPGRRTPFVYHHGDVPLSLPSVPHGPDTIWGLTLGMADDLLGRIGAAPGLPRAPRRND